MTDIFIDNNDVLIIKAKGHANFSKKNDIVCASISSLLLNTILGIQDIIKADLDGIINSGDINVEIKKTKANNSLIELQIKILINSLKKLEEQYPKNIKLNYKGI